MARQAVENRISTLVATPHFYGMRDAAQFRAVPDAVHQFQTALDEAGIPLQILPGAEVFPSPSLLEALQAGVPLTIGPSRYLLLEMPLSMPPIGLESLLYSLQLEGYAVILAHPERVRHFQQHPAMLEALMHRGVLLQGDAGSLLGQFGWWTKKAAQTLLRNRWIHSIASDAHDIKRRRCNLRPAYELVTRLSGEDEAQRLLEENPARIIRGDAVLM